MQTLLLCYEGFGWVGSSQEMPQTQRTLRLRLAQNAAPTSAQDDRFVVTLEW